jgi:hypothetical protein
MTLYKRSSLVANLNLDILYVYWYVHGYIYNILYIIKCEPSHLYVCHVVSVVVVAPWW